jgi:hypothetical protein
MIAALISWKTLAALGALAAALWIVWDWRRGPCSYCGGTGFIPSYGACDACEGYGR